MGIEDDYNEEQKKLLLHNMNAAHKLAVSFRGQVLENFAILENNIELAIAEYFTSNHSTKSSQLIHVLLGDASFNFNSKKRMVIFIMKNAFPAFSNPKHLDDILQNASAFRNIVAHRKLDVRPEILLKFDGESINLIYYTTKDYLMRPSIHTLSKKLVEKEIHSIAEAAIDIAELGILIRNS